MIGQSISHYKIIEKLGEVPNFLTSVSQRVNENLSLPAEHVPQWQAGIPPAFGGSWNGRSL